MSRMMDRPLLISSLIEHAAQNHTKTEIVSRTIEGGTAFTLHRSNYGEACRRAKRLSNDHNAPLVSRSEGECTEVLLHTANGGARFGGVSFGE